MYIQRAYKAKAPDLSRAYMLRVIIPSINYELQV